MIICDVLVGLVSDATKVGDIQESLEKYYPPQH